MSRISFKKAIAKAAERAAKKDPNHEVSSGCLCLQCATARAQIFSSSLEEKLFEAVQRKVAAKEEDPAS